MTIQVARDVSPRLRFVILHRDGYTCQYCGAQAPDVQLEVDHIIPLAQGGTNEADNLLAACLRCNRGKGDALPDDDGTMRANEQRRLARAKDGQGRRVAYRLENIFGEGYYKQVALFEPTEYGQVLFDRSRAAQEIIEEVLDLAHQVAERYDAGREAVIPLITLRDGLRRVQKWLDEYNAKATPQKAPAEAKV